MSFIYIFGALMSQTQELPELGIKHGGNWPTWAEYGVTYSVLLITGDSKISTRYFVDKEELDSWLAKNNKPLEIWYWDWGPNKLEV